MSFSTMLLEHRALSLAATRTILRTSRRQCEWARSLSCTAPTLQADSGAPQPTSSPRARSRAARFAPRPGADMVGPPDPISNLRPVKYGSAFDEEDAQAGQAHSVMGAADAAKQRLAQSQARAQATHPYSLSEFSSFASDSSSSSSGPPQLFTSSQSGTASRIGARRSHSAYFYRLLERLETAELEHRLRRIRADAFHQRFWTDNNLRFQGQLREYQEHIRETLVAESSDAAGASKQAPAAAAEGGHGSQGAPREEGPPLPAPAPVEPRSDALAPFYTAWLSANSARHKSYNRALVGGLFSGLGPAIRYERLRWWAGVVRRVEKAMGRGI